MDEFHGEGGTFEIDKATGKRKRVGEPYKASHPEGDLGPRDKDGKLIKPVQAETQSAVIEPKPAPWEEPKPDLKEPEGPAVKAAQKKGTAA